MSTTVTLDARIDEWGSDQRFTHTDRTDAHEQTDRGAINNGSLWRGD
jgi:hypothetical protein